jgi:uncharacterized membrane protein YidH (DUF202 family)
VVDADATRRTRLASERTYLAWVRTALAAFAVGLGAGRVVPALTKGPRWPYEVVGAGFALMGVALMVYGYLRQRAVDAALARGEFAEPDHRTVIALAATGSVLGLAVVVLIVWAG